MMGYQMWQNLENVLRVTHHCCLSGFSCFLLSYTTVKPQLETQRHKIMFRFIPGLSLSSSGATECLQVLLDEHKMNKLKENK